MAYSLAEAATMQKSFWKATTGIWRPMAIRVTITCQGSGAVPVGRIFVDILSTLFPRGSSMIAANRQ